MDRLDLVAMAETIGTYRMTNTIATRFEDLNRDTKEEQIALYDQAFAEAKEIIRAVGKTKSSKRRTSDNRVVAKFMGELSYKDIARSKPVDMDIRNSNGVLLLGSVTLFQTASRKSESRFSRFHLPGNNFGTVRVALFGYSETMGECSVMNAETYKNGDFVHSYYAQSPWLTSLQEVELVASAVSLIHQRV